MRGLVISWTGGTSSNTGGSAFVGDSSSGVDEREDACRGEVRGDVLLLAIDGCCVIDRDNLLVSVPPIDPIPEACRDASPAI